MPNAMTPGQTTGADHFLYAELLLSWARRTREENDGNLEHGDRLVAVAQVHATLALAGASATPAHRSCVGYGWNNMTEQGAPDIYPNP